MTDKQVTLLDTRATFYGVLSRLYGREVDCELLKRLSSFTSNLKEEPGWSDIHRSLLQAEDLDDLARRLRREYTYLFVLGANKRLQPYESVQRTEEKLLMQRPWVEVKKIYAREGLAIPDGEERSEDHLALELAFLEHMIDRSIRALKDGKEKEYRRLLDAQKNFLSRLRSWVPSYCDAVCKEAREDFYCGLANATREVLTGDWEFLRSIMMVEQKAAQK